MFNPKLIIMKKLLMLAMVCVLGTAAANAQGWFLGGEVGVNHNKIGDNKTTSFQIAPQVGYMFNEKWGMFVDLEYDYSKSNGVKTHTYGFDVGVLRSYHIVSNFYYVPRAMVGYNHINVKDGSNTNAFGVGIDFLRFEFKPSEHWGFNIKFGTVNYVHGKENGGGPKFDNFNFNVFNNEVGVGFNYYF